MRLFSVVIILLLAVASNSFADQSTKFEKIKELMKVEGLYEEIDQQKKSGEDQAKVIGNKMTKQIEDEFPELNEPFLTALDNAYNKFIEMAKPSFTTEEALNKLGEYYGEQITEDELDKLLSFYKSPLGQKDIQATRIAMPKWTKFFTDKNQAVLEKATQAYIADLRKIVELEKVRLSSGQ